MSSSCRAAGTAAGTAVVAMTASLGSGGDATAILLLALTATMALSIGTGDEERMR